MKQLKRVREYLINNNTYQDTLYRDIKFMKDGRVKSLFCDDFIVNFRYSAKRVSSIIAKYIWSDKLLYDITIKYVRNIIRVDININSSACYDYKFVDMKNGKIIHIDNINDIHLYVMKYLYLSNRKVYIQVNNTYDKRVKPKEYMFTPEIGSYNNIACVNSYCENLQTNEKTLFQSFRFIDKSKYIILRENLLHKTHMTYNDNNMITLMVNDDTKVFTEYNYNDKNQLVRIKSDKITIIEYDNNDNISDIYVDGKLYKSYDYDTFKDNTYYYLDENKQLFRVIEKFYNHN